MNIVIINLPDTDAISVIQLQTLTLKEYNGVYFEKKTFSLQTFFHTLYLFLF